MLQILCKTTADLTRPETREAWARLIGTTIAGKDPQFTVLTDDGLKYVFHPDSWWRLVFIDGDTFAIQHDHNYEKLKALAIWLHLQWNVTLVENTLNGVYRHALETRYRSVHGDTFVLRFTDTSGHNRPAWVRE